MIGNNMEKTTPAEALGFKIGENYEVVARLSGYYSEGDIVKFIMDDGSDCPLFEHVSGNWLSNSAKFYVSLIDIKPPSLDSIQPTMHQSCAATEVAFNITKEYIKAKYPYDTFLLGLIERCSER